MGGSSTFWPGCGASTITPLPTYMAFGVEEHQVPGLQVGARDVRERPTGRRRIDRPPEVAETMSELGREFGFVEVLNPRGVIFRFAPLKFADCLPRGYVTGFCVTQPGERTCFHGVKVGHKSWRRESAGACPGGAGKVSRFMEPAHVRSLMAHRIEDARTE